MVNITLLEIHLDESTFEAVAPFATSKQESDSDPEVTSPGPTPGIAGVFGMLVGLVFLAGVAYIIRKKVFGTSEMPSLEEEEEIEIEDIDI